MIGMTDSNDPLLRAKSLLAQELPMGVVAQQVGLPMARLRRVASEENWVRRSRRDPYSPAIRVEALKAYDRTGSMTKAAKLFGIARQTLMRWIRAASPYRRPALPQWRCYCAPYGVRVEGSMCPACGTIRADEANEDDLLN